MRPGPPSKQTSKSDTFIRTYLELTNGGEWAMALPDLLELARTTADAPPDE